MYLVLSQQTFVPGTETGYGSYVKVFGSKMYLSKDFAYVDYELNRYILSYQKTQVGQGTNIVPAVRGMRGPVNVVFKKHFYSAINPKTKEQLELIIIQAKDVNTYLHDQFEFDHVLFDNKRFEVIFTKN